MQNYIPADLPEIDEVQILVLSDVEGEDAMAAATDSPKAIARDMQAQRMAEIWRALPPGEPKRCHTPRFGLRFLSAGSIVAQASICWECSTIYGDVDGTAFHFDFDGKASASQQLLFECQRIAKNQIGGGR